MITKESYLEACLDGDIDTVSEYLSQPNADVDCVDEHGYTAIMKAIDNLEILNLVLKAKPEANLDAQNNNGETALTLAVKDGCSDAVSLLLDFGANPNFREDDGCTPLMIAAIYESPESAEALVASGADLEAVNEVWSGHTALTLALEEKDSSVARVLIKAGANITNVNRVKNIFQDDSEVLDIINQSQSPIMQIKKALIAGFNGTNNPNQFVNELLSEIANLSARKASNINDANEADALIQTAMDLKDITRRAKIVKRDYSAITPTGLRPQFENYSRNNSVNNDENINHHHVKKFK